MLLGEVVATFGLLIVILGVVRSGKATTAPFAVAGYIAAAYWFTSSTSFANPAVTIGRTLSDTFAGIAPASVPAFIVAQLVGRRRRDRPRPLPVSPTSPPSTSSSPTTTPTPPERRTTMPDLEDLTLEQQHALRLAATNLHREFDGIFGTETIEQFLATSYDQFAPAPGSSPSCR